MVTIGDKIEELKNELNNLKQERLSECDFSVGEIVDVYEAPFFKDDQEKHKGRAYISNVGVNDNGDFVYRLNKVKKDGTMSGHSFCVYGKPRIEKIKD